MSDWILIKEDEALNLDSGVRVNGWQTEMGTQMTAVLDSNTNTIRTFNSTEAAVLWNRIVKQSVKLSDLVAEYEREQAIKQTANSVLFDAAWPQAEKIEYFKWRETWINREDADAWYESDHSQRLIYGITEADEAAWKARKDAEIEAAGF